ncbi:MAG: hypothetical protein KKD28_14960 [Chloroflexi bacterium]|nr:hypothetical protein [Chloroflexota bacterium]MBU1662761.1 hypothetical protein [Chloroflexota bacterium]
MNPASGTQSLFAKHAFGKTGRSASQMPIIFFTASSVGSMMETSPILTICTNTQKQLDAHNISYYNLIENKLENQFSPAQRKAAGMVACLTKCQTSWAGFRYQDTPK